MPRKRATQVETVGLTAYIKEVQFAVLHESDRAAGVLGRAYADAMVERLLRRYIAPGSSAERLLGTQGAIGTFAARTELVFGLGLISNASYGDLNLIRRIGNHFAHHVDAASFDTSPVREWCESFWASKDPSHRFKPVGTPGRARDQFNTALVLAAIELERVEHAVETVAQRSQPRTESSVGAPVA